MAFEKIKNALGFRADQEALTLTDADALTLFGALGGVASSATLALNSGGWFLRFFILDHVSRHAIHLDQCSEFLRPLLEFRPLPHAPVYFP